MSSQFSVYSQKERMLELNERLLSRYYGGATADAVLDGLELAVIVGYPGTTVEPTVLDAITL